MLVASITGIMVYLLKLTVETNDAISCAVQVEMKNTTIYFMELVDYCANKCRTVTRSLCCPLATYVTNIAGECSQVFFGQLYC